MHSTETITIPIKKEPIRLSQFLKLADVVQDGLEAKIVIAEGNVSVNNVPDVRRGRKLYDGDTVQFGDFLLQVALQE